MQRSKFSKAIALTLAFLMLVSPASALKTFQAEFGYGGAYDGNVYIERDASGNLTFTDDFQSALTLSQLYGGNAHALLSASHSDTTAAAVARGAIITGQGASPTWSRLSLGTVGKGLVSDGTDIVWGYPDMSYAINTLAFARGGLGFVSGTTGDLIYLSNANTVAKLGIGSTGQVLTVAGGLPAWAAPSGGGAGTLASVSSSSTTAGDSTYTMTSNVDVSFKNSAAARVMTLTDNSASFGVGSAMDSATYPLYLNDNTNSSSGFMVNNENTGASVITFNGVRNWNQGNSTAMVAYGSGVAAGAVGVTGIWGTPNNSQPWELVNVGPGSNGEVWIHANTSGFLTSSESGNTPAIKIGAEFAEIGKPLRLRSSAAQSITAVGNSITVARTRVKLDPDADYTLTSTPTIASGTEGDLVYITCANGEANTVTVQDEGSLAGSNLQLGAATRAISGKDVLCLLFDGSDWIEVSYANN